MTDGGESYGLYLSSFSGTPYYSSLNTYADVTFNINWDTFFNGDNHKYTKCRLRYDFLSDNAPTTNPFTPVGNNGVLLLNGINPAASYNAGGFPLGIINVQGYTITNTNVVHHSVLANNFIGSITGGTATLTISSTASPTFMLNIGDVVGFRDPNNSFLYTTKTITALPTTNAYTYTLDSVIGATAVTAQPFSCGNPYDLTYTSLMSSNLQSGIGVSIETPKGYRNLNVQLQNSNYGQPPYNNIMTGTNLQPWGLMLIFELYDPVLNDNTYTIN